VYPVDIELVQHAKPKGHKLRGTATLGYSRRESAPSSCCMCAILGQGAQFPNTDGEGANSAKHHILESQAMRTASCLGRVDVLELLLKYGGDVNELAEQETVDGPPGSPLHVAAAAGRKNVCEWLFRHGAGETLRNREGKTPKDIDYSHS
jgi:ankyrin repeat protein